MSDIMQRVILDKYPDYDFDRYSYKFGDVVKMVSNTKVFIICSAIEYVEAYVLKAGFGYKSNTKVRVPYSELPYFKSGEFVNEELPVSKCLKWNIGDVVVDPKNAGTKVLITERSDSGYYALVLESENEYYAETSIYIVNPNDCYVLAR